MTTTANPSGLPTHEVDTTPENQAYFDGLGRGVITLPRCANTECTELIWYPRAVCPFCGTGEPVWEELSGRGTIYSFSIARRTAGQWGKHTPYVLAYVELAEGPRVMTNIVGADPDSLACDQAVVASFDPIGEGEPSDSAVLRFQPA